MFSNPFHTIRFLMYPFYWKGYNECIATFAGEPENRNSCGAKTLLQSDSLQ